MKKALSILSILSFFIFIIYACTNQDENIVNTSPETKVVNANKTMETENISPEELGQIHNNILKQYYSLYGENDTEDLLEMNKRLNEISVDLYPSKFTLLSDDEIATFTEFSYGATNVTGWDYRTHSINALDDALGNGTISQDFYDMFKSLVVDGGTYEETLGKLQDYKTALSNQPASTIKTTETNFINGAISVYTSSKEYWANDPDLQSSNTSGKYFGGCDPEDQIAIADTYGSIMGGLFGVATSGGVSSVVWGAVGSWGFSKAIRMQIKKNNGKCV